MNKPSQSFVHPYDTRVASGLRFSVEIIRGHLTRLGNRRDVEVAKEFIASLQTNAGKALGVVDLMAIAQETGFGNPYSLFDNYLDAVANIAPTQR